MAGTHTLVTIARSNNNESGKKGLGTVKGTEREPVLNSLEVSGTTHISDSQMWTNGVNNLQWFNRTMWDYGESMWDQHNHKLSIVCGTLGVCVVACGMTAIFFMLVLVGSKDHWSWEHWSETGEVWSTNKGPPGGVIWLISAILSFCIFSLAMIWAWLARNPWMVLSVIFVSDIVAFLLLLAEIDLLTAVHVSSAISTFGSCYALLGTMRASRSNVRASLLWNVAFNDLLSSIGRFVPVAHCQIQAIIISTGDVGSVFWVAGIANLASFIMGNAVKLRMTTRTAYSRRRNRIIFVIWTWTALSVMIPFFTDSYGLSTDNLCWVKDNSLVDKTMQFLQFYAPLCAVMLYCGWVYRPSCLGGIIWQVMSSNERFRGSGTSGHVSNPRVLIVYPLYLLFAWLPGFVSGLILRSVETDESWLQNLQTVNKSLMGMANAMIYYHLDPKLKNDLMRFCGSRSFRHSEHADGAGTNKMPFRFQTSRSTTDERWTNVSTNKNSLSKSFPDSMASERSDADKESRNEKETWGTTSISPNDGSNPSENQSS